MRGGTRVICGAFVPLALALSASIATAGPPLRRNLESYVIFGLRSVGLKNITVTGACNTGVDCAQPTGSSSCGVISQENPLYADGSQIAGDVARFTKDGGIISQLFSNRPTGLDNVFINAPPVMSPDPLPIIGNRDGDGAPSCRAEGGQCVVDPGDLEVACGFPQPFPACGGPKVTVLPNGDCIGVADSTPGNGRCDLAPGVYGDLDVQDDAKLTFLGGTYAFCRFTFGRDTETIALAATTANVSGDVRISNASLFGPPPGTACGQIVVNAKGAGEFAFGRNADVNGFFCAPERTLLLGHNNNLSGRFFGDTISADSNNRAYCCGGGGPDECVDPTPPADGPLRRQLDAYFILAMKRASLKNMSLGTPCNIGVNCGADTSGRSECGVLATGSLTMVDFSQLAADQAFLRKPGARVYRLFRNNDAPLDNVQLVAPAPNPQTFATPILAGTCDASCTVDVAAMKTACGFPQVFPTCVEANEVKANAGEDCLPYDTTPGNQQCDLPPGQYGTFSLQNGARANFVSGDYTFCRFRMGRKAKLTGDATKIYVPNGGVFRASNGSELGEDCGDFEVFVDGADSKVAFGRSGLVAAEICAPEAKIALGHNNVLVGQFVADTISADLNNVGRCCDACPPVEE